MSRETGFQKWAFVVLLALHIGWIGNHMRLVATDQINPWRLGGYAMYTIPNPSSTIQVFDPNFPDTPLVASFLRYDAASRSTNPGRAFRCAAVSADALLGFFDENQDLIGRNVVLVYGERGFVHSPPSTTMEMRGTVSVTWQDERNLSYISKFCGREVSGSVALP